jgi:hypothetical protein
VQCFGEGGALSGGMFLPEGHVLSEEAGGGISEQDAGSRSVVEVLDSLTCFGSGKRNVAQGHFDSLRRRAEVVIICRMDFYNIYLWKEERRKRLWR